VIAAQLRCGPLSDDILRDTRILATQTVE